MTVPIPPFDEPFLDKQNRVRVSWRLYLEGIGTQSNEENSVASMIGGAHDNEASGMAAAAMVRQSLRTTQGVPPVTALRSGGGPQPSITAARPANVHESQPSTPPAAARVIQFGNGVTLIQDTAANISNYPTSLYNPGVYFATDTFGIYRSDGTAWTQLAFISDTAYGVGWNGVTNIAPSQNAVYDQFVVVLALIAAIPTLASGTYTPTATIVANLDAVTAYECQYLRVGNVVTVSGRIDVDPTTTLLTTQAGISLPVASNIGAPEDVAGAAATPGIAGMSAGILGDTVNDRAQLDFKATDVTNQAMYFTFTYSVI